MICTVLRAIALHLQNVRLLQTRIRVQFPRNQRKNPHLERAQSCLLTYIFLLGFYLVVDEVVETGNYGDSKPKLFCTL
ncbi:MAG: hypothetical protein ICV78_23285 [Tolypothrix sp. Co-bin9]|nr:hypothetical protein [Tolypothrix sp. Co-bin9]